MGRGVSEGKERWKSPSKKLNPLSLGLSGTVVLTKSWVKTEVPRGHQSCPGGLWKAVLFLNFSLDSCYLSCRTKQPHCEGSSVTVKGLLFVVCAQPVLQREQKL